MLMEVDATVLSCSDDTFCLLSMVGYYCFEIVSAVIKVKEKWGVGVESQRCQQDHRILLLLSRTKGVDIRKVGSVGKIGNLNPRDSGCKHLWKGIKR